MDLFSILQNYLSLLQTQMITTILYVPLALIILDVVTGILAAMKQNVFSSKELFLFLQHNVLPYLCIVVAVFVVYSISGNTLALQVSMLLGMSMHSISMLGSIVENLKELQVPAPIIKEIEQLGQSYFQGYPPVYKEAPASYAIPAPVLVPQPIEKQATQVQPTLPPEVVRASTPAPASVAQPLPMAPVITLPIGL